TVARILRPSISSEIAMFPWLWFWAPQIHLPLSGSVAQQIEPDIDWFFGAIKPNAGDSRIERDAFEVASYGRQIGLLTEAVLAGTGGSAVSAEQGRIARGRLEEIRERIEAKKGLREITLAESIAAQLEELRRTQPAEFNRLVATYQPQATLPAA